MLLPASKIYFLLTGWDIKVFRAVIMKSGGRLFTVDALSEKRQGPTHCLSLSTDEKKKERRKVNLLLGAQTGSPEL